MAIKKLCQNGINENGENTIMDGLSFVRAINNNANELGTNTKLDLETHNTPEFIAKALREQTEISEKVQKIGYQTPGGPDDMPTHEEEGAPVDSPSELKDGLAQIYNKIVETESPIEEKEVSDSSGLQQAAESGDSRVSISGDMSADSSIEFNSYVQINGNDNTITNSAEAEALSFNNGASIKALKVENTGDSENAIKLANSDYNIEDVKMSGAKYGIEVNTASATFTGNIDVSNNKSAGINVLSGNARASSRVDVSKSNLINTTETEDIPTIKSDMNSAIIVGEGIYSVSDSTDNTVKYFVNKENADKLREKLGLDPLPGEDDNSDVLNGIDLQKDAKAFLDNYYNKYANKTITSGDAEFDNDIVYENLGAVESDSETTVSINKQVIDNSNVSISIGNNGFIKAPLFKVEENILYVSTLLLALKGAEENVEVVYGDNKKIINSKEMSTVTMLPVTEVLALNTQPGYTNEIETNEDNTDIVEISSYGTHAIGFIIQNGSEKLLNPSLYYIYSSGPKNMGISTPERMDGKDVTFALYAKYKTGPYTEELERVFDYELLIPGIGLSKFKVTTKLIVEPEKETENAEETEAEEVEE